jgi:microcystin-dependent protein
MFLGTSTNIPDGWALCDGTNDTPDLIDKFIVGAGDIYGIGNTGGSADSVTLEHAHNVFINQGGSHTHTITRGSSCCGSSAASNGNGSSVTTQPAGSHSHSSITVEPTGVDGTDKNIPPYYGVLYIIKEAN